jgi:hypothetical protein
VELLVRTSTSGKSLMGLDQQLLTRAAAGDDLTIFIESIGVDEYVALSNYVVTGDRVYGLGSSHSALQQIFHASDSNMQPQTIVRHIHDSRKNAISACDFLEESKTLTTVNGTAPDKRFAWYSTRRYVELTERVERLPVYGDQFKILLKFSSDFRLIMKPDIVYFPYEGRQYLVKSSAMLLPSRFAFAPDRYIRDGKPLTENQSYSLVYLNIGSDDLLTIVHQPRFTILSAQVGKQRDDTSSTTDPRTGVTNIKCDHTILIPEQ